MKLAEIFGDHMVLQRNKEICLFGYGKGKIEVEFCGEKFSFTSDADDFRVYLPSYHAGGPYEMKVILDGDERIIKDIMIGDVYIAGGQSNMEFCLKYTADIEYTDNQNIRFFTEPNNAEEDGTPVKYSADWFICEGKAVDNFSAIGYYFSVKLQKHTNVPIGIVSCSKGASRVDAWTAPEFVETDEYQKMVAVKHNDYNVYKFNHNSWLYKNKLLNIVPFANSGVLWYQGESNRRRDEAIYYAKMLEIMIENWRKLWNCNLPFYCVQIMPCDEPATVSDWAIIRHQQELVSKTVDNTYLVTLVDTGEKELLHPEKKKKVSYALANAVRNVQFKENIEYCGPVLENYRKIENGIELIFSHADGLHIKGENLLDTYIYDENDEQLPVSFIIEENRLKLCWKPNNKPNRLALGYNNAPMHNLYNSSDYLASPFELIL